METEINVCKQYFVWKSKWDRKNKLIWCYRGEYFPLNPDIDRPSPPRQGAARIFENPFDVNDEDAVPVNPDKLSPSHIFESSSLEEELLQKSRLENETRPVFDSRTFVIKKTPSPTNASQNFVFPGSKVIIILFLDLPNSSFQIP